MAGTPENPGHLYTLDWANEPGYADCTTPTTPPTGWRNDDYLKNTEVNHPNGEPAFRMTCLVHAEPVRSVGPAARFQLNQGDCQVTPSGNVRAELKFAQYEDLHVERWYGFSIYLADWDVHVDDNLTQKGEILSQWHQPANSGGSPPLALMTQDGHWAISLRESFTNPALTGSVNTNLVLYNVGQWTDWVVHVQWSAGSDGYIEMWKDGQQLNLSGILGTTGQNEFAATDSGSWPNPHNPDPRTAKGNYMKFGIYKWGWKPFAPKCTPGTIPPVATTKQRVMYYDSLRISAETDRAVAKGLFGL